MKIKYLLLALIFFPSVTFAQSVWFPAGSGPTTLRPASSAWGILVPQLGGAGTRCLQVDNTGLFSVASAACGSGGGGTAGGTWATTTSSVTNQLLNYSLNNTDIVIIGSTSATSSAKYYFDPNLPLAKLNNQFFGLSSTTLQNFTFINATGTSATTTNLFATNASTTNLFGTNITGFGLASCSGTSALTFSGTVFGCAAQPQGTVTSVSGTANRITSTGGATPVIDISGSYVGQASITTLGTLSSGAVPASLVTAGTFGAGNYIFPAQLQVNSSTTLQNFTGLNSTTTNATTTSIISTTASTSKLFLATGLGCLEADATGLVKTSTGAACGSGSGGGAYPFQLTGNATSTKTQFNGGLTSFASTTIGNSLGAGGLTIDGNATTTGIIWQTGTWGHFGASSCNTGGLAFGGLQGIEVCGSDNTNTGGVQAIVSNSNSGTAAWGGLTLNNNLADNTVTHFFGMFFNSSNYTDTSYGTAIGRADLGIIQNSDGTLALISSSTTEALAPQGIEFITGGTATANIRGRINVAGNFGLGTTTPQWKLQIASSTGAQLTLSDNTTAAINHWSFRNSGGIFYLATSSPSTFATSSKSALSIDVSGFPTFPSLSGVGCIQADANGKLTNIGSACGSGGGGTSNSKWATSTDLTSIIPNGGLTTQVGVGTTSANAMFDVYSNGTVMPFRVSSSTSPFQSYLEVELNGSVGIATSSAMTSGLAIEQVATTPALIIANQGSTTPTLFVNGTNGNGRIGIGTSTPLSQLHINFDASTTATGFNQVFKLGSTPQVSSYVNGTYFSMNTPANFTGYLLDLQRSGTSVLKIDNNDNLITSGTVVSGNSLQVANFGGIFWSGRTNLNSSADGILNIQNSAQTSFTRLNFGGTTTAFPGIARSLQRLIVTLGDGTNGGYFAVGTTTPQFMVQFASSTAPQLTLSDPGVLTNNHWSLRNIAGLLYLATSSPTTFATSSTAVFALNVNGFPIFSSLAGCNGLTNALGTAADGTVQCDVVSSDQRLKKNISPISNGLSTIMSLKPISFDWKDPSMIRNGADGKTHLGFIAQDVQKVVPGAVGTSSPNKYTNGDPSLTLDKTELIAPLVKAVQEQQAQIEAQQRQIDALVKEIKNLKK